MLINEKRLAQQLRTFEKILSDYKFDEPLARFLTSYYKLNKQMGSNDRRTASRLLYNYYRLGKSLEDLSGAQLTKLAIAEFLCNTSSDFVTFLEPKLVPLLEEDLNMKVTYLENEYQFSLQSIFPLITEVSSKIDLDKFLKSHFQQPLLFIRIHNGKEKAVKLGLKAENIPFEEIGSDILSFQNGTQLDRVKAIQGKYEVQDLSSQRTAELFHAKPNESWWDACAGSGGKSILLKQTVPSLKLLVSDIRDSILRNLDVRFDTAGIKEFRRKIIDLTRDPSVLIHDEKFDGIVLDVPCSGSGTWGRTPETLTSFSKERLAHYVGLQRQILENIIEHVKPGKPLIYITCSVYERENENQIEFLQSKGFKLEEMKYFEGAEHGADTLFAARLIR